MSLNSMISGERLHIAFFGKRNAGKSSLVNAVTGQELSVVSDVKGTTTDPVRKAMELLPLGPVVIIDTPGFDDEGALGELRVRKTRQILDETDFAVLVIDSTVGISAEEKELIDLFAEKKLPYILAYTKSDLKGSVKFSGENEITVSAVTTEGIGELKEMLGRLGKSAKKEKFILKDIVEAGDAVILVIPIDAAAPKGRIILPQQMVLRELLDCHCTPICCQVSELKHTLEMLTDKPKLVITDSQAFGKAAKIVPSDVTLTSFSILMARYKGELSTLVEGASMLEKLKDGDKVLISEGCTHHRQCGDIGTEKMPAWIREFTGKSLDFSFTGGREFPEDLGKYPCEYKLIVHCGGCMLNEAEMKSRIARAENAGIPIVNYGVAIAHMHGILKQSLKPFPNAAKLLD